MKNNLCGLLALVCVIFNTSAEGCPFSKDDPLHTLRQWAGKAIVRIDTIGTKECTNSGTGFFVNAAGDVLTAAHVVPADCKSDYTDIKVRWEEDSGKLSLPIDARVIGRSSLDVALLKLEKTPEKPLQFLLLESSPDVALLKNECILLPSHYFEQTDTYTSFAEIGSVALEGGDRRWALSGIGANPSRSGSPVILSNGRAVAMFLARPGDVQDRATKIENRGYILPIAAVPKNEIDLIAVSSASGKFEPFLKLPPDSAKQAASRYQNTAFSLSIFEPGNRTNPNEPIYLIPPEGQIKRFGDIGQALIQLAVRGGTLGKKVTTQRHFEAAPGYVFLPETLAIRDDYRNPQKVELPSRACGGNDDSNCFSVKADGQILEFRVDLYPGIDSRSSGIDAEIHIAQRPKSTVR